MAKSLSLVVRREGNLLKTRLEYYHTMKETLKKAGYTYVKCNRDGTHLLRDDTGKLEIWFNNKNHASYGLIFKNTHLEFARSFQPVNKEEYPLGYMQGRGAS